MSDRIGLLKKFGKNVCALVLAVGAVVSTISSISVDVQAAQYFTFIDMNNQQNTNLNIIAGTTINILSDLPQGYNLSAPYFSITKGTSGNGENVKPEQNGNFYVSGATTQGGNKWLSPLQIGPNAGGDGVLDSGEPLEYSLNGLMSTTNSEETDVTINPPGSSSFVGKAKSNRALALTMTSSLSFTLNAKADLQYSNVSATGWFNPYYDGQPVISAGSTETTLSIKIDAKSSASTQEPIAFEIDVGSAENMDKILDGTTFNITYYRPSSTPLILRVYSPEYAVEELKTNLESQKDKYLTGDGQNTVIKLKSGDDFDANGISGNFTAMRRVQMHNSMVDIDWEWVPEDSQYQNVVQFLGGDTVTIVPALGNAKGKLIAHITYTPTVKANNPGRVGTADAEIPMTVLGIGSPPKISFEQQVVGKYGDPLGIVQRFQQPMQMDVYNGNVDPDIYAFEPERPYKYTGSVNFGEYMGMASKLIVKMDKIGQSDGEVQLSLPQRGVQNYSFGTALDNKSQNKEQYIEQFEIRATKAGDVRLVFEFYNSAGELIGKASDYTYLINIVDNSPTSDPSLSELVMKATPESSTESFEANFPAGIVEYGFDSKVINYGTDTAPIQLPYLVKEITFKPQYSILKNKNNIIMQVNGDSTTNQSLTNGRESSPVALTELEVVTITFDCKAENGDPMRYTVKVMRMPKSSNVELENLIVKPEKDSPEEEYFDLTPAFDPERFGTVLPYEVHVPYGQTSVNVKAVAKDAWAAKVEITADPLIQRSGFLSRIVEVFKPNADQVIQLKYEDGSTANGYNLTTVTVRVTPEDQSPYREYVIKIYRDDPSEDATIKEPEVSYWLKGTSRPKDEKSLALDGYDAAEYEIFTERVEYSMDRVKVIITPNDYLAKKVTVTLPDGRSKESPHKAVAREPQPLAFTFDEVNGVFNQNNILTLKVTVDPEKPNVTGTPYYIYIEREPPNRDTTAKVTLTNMLTSEPIDFGYTDVIDTYPTKDIKYTPGDMKVLVQVAPNSETTTVTVNGETPRPDGTAVSLTAGSTTTVTIVLTAEDGSTRTITIPLKYKGPSNAAYLSNLTAGGLKFLPDPTPFDKKKTTYKIEIPKGTTTLPVTATLLKDGSKDDSSNATITIEGVTVKDGEAFNYQPTDKTGKITIVVTAQDGKTKRTYTITYKNWNLLIPNDEDTLKDLWVDYGDMQPEFSPAVTEYEVYVKPDAMDLKIYPKLKDKDGDIEVTAESKVLTKFEDYYSTSLMDDEMDIHIYVWSEKAVVESASSNTNTDTANAKPARSAAREYILHVYRNDDEKIGNLKPVTAEMVDFTSADPIVIDITKYTVISADVFNTLKTDYADKSIIFKGNDYTLQVFGADIDGLVPNADSFDLKFSFRTPDEDKILDLIDDTGRNGNVDPVYYYFNQHGALPAEMLLTVDLGRHYRNTELYWNYYNKERERIDYYGYVHTNAKGTFSVPISHFSTYMTTDDKIRGAENKSDEYGNPALTPETENLNAPGSTDKAIPNTGAGVAG